MNWSDIKLSQYQKIVEIANTDLPNFNKEMELVGYLFGIPYDELLNMPLEKFKHYSKKLDFLQDVYEGDMHKEFTINGVEYVVGWELQKKTAGQFIDLSELTKEPDLINDNLHKILAVICLPKGSKYDGNITERANIFREYLTMDIVYPISGFFLTILKSSLPIIQDYLSQEIQKQQKDLMEMIKASMSIGDGTAHLTN